jgi:lipopolysaccharide export system permease protein
MKILDRYIMKSFLTGYAIAFCVLVGLWIIIDLFVNLDEFAEQSDLGIRAVSLHILTFYGLHATVYFRDLAGIITVVAAVFCLGKMVRDNELVAMLASGVSTQRIVVPILCLAMLSTAFWVADQELLIPAISSKLARGHGDVPGEESFKVSFLSDRSGSLIFARAFFVKTATLDAPAIVTRRKTDRVGIWEPTGWISADKARYNATTREWDLDNGLFIDARPENNPRVVHSYRSPGLVPEDIPVLCESEYKSLYSFRQLSALARCQTRVQDMAEIASQKCFRVTEPLINLIMFMVSLPVLICRDPKAMKSAIVVSFVLTAACFATTFVCKLLSTEVVFAGRVMPELWAWLPVFIFVPVALIEIDAIRT